jgi:hypothetical protein
MNIGVLRGSSFIRDLIAGLRDNPWKERTAAAVSLWDSGATFVRVGEEIGVSAQRASKIVIGTIQEALAEREMKRMVKSGEIATAHSDEGSWDDAEAAMAAKDYAIVPVWFVPVSVRLANALKRSGVRSVAEMIAIDVDAFAKTKGVGSTTVSELSTVISEINAEASRSAA